jgi:hypothetical protein
MTRGGALLDYERSEALWNHCALALFTGASDFACAGRFLEMARNFGNPRATAGTLLMCGIRNPDIARGLELLAEARELATQSRDSYRDAVATRWLGVLQSTVDPPALFERGAGSPLSAIGTARVGQRIQSCAQPCIVDPAPHEAAFVSMYLP